MMACGLAETWMMALIRSQYEELIIWVIRDSLFQDRGMLVSHCISSHITKSIVNFNKITSCEGGLGIEAKLTFKLITWFLIQSIWKRELAWENRIHIIIVFECPATSTILASPKQEAFNWSGHSSIYRVHWIKRRNFVGSEICFCSKPYCSWMYGPYSLVQQSILCFRWEWSEVKFRWWLSVSSKKVASYSLGIQWVCIFCVLCERSWLHQMRPRHARKLG